MTKQHNVIWYFFTLLVLLLSVSMPISATEPEIIVDPPTFTVTLTGGDTRTEDITVRWTGSDTIQCFISTDITPDDVGIDVTYSEPSPFTLEPSIDYVVTMTIEAAINIMPGVYIITTNFSCTEPENIPPIANFTYSPSNPVSLEFIQFTDTSTDLDGTIESWLWDFDDGHTSTEQDPIHSYAVVGTYTVTLVVTDDDGTADSTSTEITIVIRLANVYTDKESYVIGENVTRGIENTLTCDISVGCLTMQRFVVGEWKNASLSLYTMRLLLPSEKWEPEIPWEITEQTEPGEYRVKGDYGIIGNGDYSGYAYFNITTGIDPSPPPPQPPGPPSDIPPVADASAGEPYTGTVGEEIIFDGSLSYDDGYIKSWFWNFGDETNGTGETTTHNYSDPGTYKVTLTVKDDQGYTNTYETTAFITQSNRPPSTPEIDGPTKGSKNIVYNFSATSVDLDNNSIEYTFDWDDGNTSISDFLPNGTTYTVTHSWALAGIYTITVTAYDNETYSGTAKLTVLIDVHYVGDIGYLIDDDSDGIYDSFYSNATGNETAVELQDNGKYLIDGMYEYDPETGVLALYDVSSPVEDDGLIYYVLLAVVAVVVAISVLIHIIFFKEKKKKKKKKKKGKKGKKKKKQKKR